MKSFKLVLLFFALSFSLKAQTVNDVFTSKSITWYGIDFSKSVLVGTTEVWGEPAKVKELYIPAWNNFVITEPKKYDLQKSFRKDIVSIDLKKVTEINRSIAMETIIMTQNDETLLTESEIAKQVAKYADPSKNGVGAVLLVEYFDKWKAMGMAHLVFFNAANGNPLLIKTLDGQAAGFGLRNYWAKTIFIILNKCEKNWGKWKKEAGVK